MIGPQSLINFLVLLGYWFIVTTTTVSHICTLYVLKKVSVCVYLDNLLPTQLKIVLRLWKSRDTLKSCKNAFNWILWIQQNILKVRSQERVSLHELLHLSSLCPSCEPLKWMYSHHGKEYRISFFLSHTQAYVWSTCSEGQLLWPSVLRRRWRWMREAGSCWRTDHSASSYREKVTLKVTAHTQA